MNGDRRRGFTLIELLVVMAIIATLLSIVAPRYFTHLDRAREAALRETLVVVRDAIDKFHGDTGRYPESLEELVSQLPNSVDAEVSNPAYLEITAAGVDKATGVRIAAERSGIRLQDVVAIGDGRNDLGLFRNAGGSIAPANADESVLAEADYLTASNDEDGVAIALRWLATLPPR